MPLSKKRNAELMRKLRYNRRLAAPAGSNSVVPKPPEPSVEDILIARDYLDNADVPTEDRKLEPMPLYIDADGNIVYE